MLLDAEPDHAILLLDLLSFFLFPLHLRGWLPSSNCHLRLT
jgi:hypothetical protein